MNKITKVALIDALATAGYIALLGLFFYFGAKIKIGQGNDYLAPVTFLMVFVFSAAITSYFMLGKPAQWYIDGKKKEALSLVTQTLVIFFAITLTALITLYLLSLDLS